MPLPVNFQDAVFDGRRKYRMIQNQDGTVSFEDMTTYTQQGSRYGASDINLQNQTINDLAQTGGNRNLAPNETGSAATQAYVAGQYVIVGGLMYEVTDAIAIDDPFVIYPETGYNIKPTTVGEELTDVNQNLTQRVPLYNPSDDFWYVNGQKYKKANLGWDGYFYNKGDYPADKFTPNWNQSMHAIGNGATPSGSQGITGQNFVLSVSSYVASADGSANGHEHILPIKLQQLDAGKIIIKYYMVGDSGVARRLNFGIKSSSVASGENAMWMCAYGRDPWANVIKQTGVINVGSDVTVLNTAEINISAGDTANDAYLAVAYGGLGSYSNSITIYIESIQYVANE